MATNSARLFAARREARPRTEMARQARFGSDRVGCKRDSPGYGALRRAIDRTESGGLIPGPIDDASAICISREHCDLIASDVNANRNFSATVPEKTEIAGEFVPDFNIFRQIMAGATGAIRAQTSHERTTGKDNNRHIPERVMNRTSARRFAARHDSPGVADLADLVHDLASRLFDPYRPELHYMRGPGPKWHAKHDPAPGPFDAMPALVRVRVKR